MLDPGITLAAQAGELCVSGWPSGLPVPFGLRRDDRGLRGPLRLRRQVRERLERDQLPFVDRSGPPPRPDCGDGPTGLDPLAATALAAWRDAGCQGVLAGLPPAARTAVVAAAARTGNGLLVVPDSAATSRWLAALADRLAIPVREHGTPSPGSPDSLAPLLRVATSATAARDLGWLGRRIDLLALDDAELLAAHHTRAITDGSAALRRLALTGATVGRSLLTLTVGIGPLAIARREAPAAAVIERHVPLDAADRAAYDDAWHQFLIAFDRFAALHPRARFAAFVAWSRAHGSDRAGLRAWHRARRLAAWNPRKVAVTAGLLAAHRGQRVLVFTPDRASAYQLAREHLIAPLTAELCRRERQSLLHAFHRGALPALVGPRLLDLGVEPGHAEVGIAIASPRTAAEFAARRQRIATDGVFHQLIAQHTLEENHVRAAHAAAAAAPAPVRQRGR